MVRHDGFAAVANDKWLPFFDSKKRNKKKAEIVIGPFEMGLRQAAGRTDAGIAVEDFYFR